MYSPDDLTQYPIFQEYMQIPDEFRVYIESIGWFDKSASRELMNMIYTVAIWRGQQTHCEANGMVLSRQDFPVRIIVLTDGTIRYDPRDLTPKDTVADMVLSCELLPGSCREINERYPQYNIKWASFHESLMNYNDNKFGPWEGCVSFQNVRKVCEAGGIRFDPVTMRCIVTKEYCEERGLDFVPQIQDCTMDDAQYILGLLISEVWANSNRKYFHKIRNACAGARSDCSRIPGAPNACSEGDDAVQWICDIAGYTTAWLPGTGDAIAVTVRDILSPLSDKMPGNCLEKAAITSAIMCTPLIGAVPAYVACFAAAMITLGTAC